MITEKVKELNEELDRVKEEFGLGNFCDELRADYDQLIAVGSINMTSGFAVDGSENSGVLKSRIVGAYTQMINLLVLDLNKLDPDLNAEMVRD